MSSKKHAAIAALTAAALTVPTVALAGDAGAAAKAHGFYPMKVLSRKYVGPLQFAVGKSRIYVADSFTSTLNVLQSGRVIAHGGNPSNGGDLSGVGLNEAAGEVAYTWSGGAHKKTKFVLRRAGKTVYSINLAAYEGRNNPDKVVHYGVDHPSKCVSNALQKAGIPVSYSGEKDSHPYSTTYLGKGVWAVADAGANAIFKIDTAKHRISSIVLPRQPLKVSKAFAQASHLPNCVVGITYYTEAVPTDVESGPDGSMYASVLPGGPEGAPGIPPRGRIYKVSPSGTVSMIGSGFASLTNIAVRPNGYIYAAELGAGRVTRLINGKPGPALYKHVGAVAVEWANGHLYVANAPAAAQQKGGASIVELGYK